MLNIDSDNIPSYAYKLFETLVALSVETPEGQTIRCSAKYLLAHGYSQKMITNSRTQLRNQGLVQTRPHYHHQIGGSCADYIITSKGMDFAREKGMNIGTISWAGIPDVVYFTPKKEASIVADYPNTEPYAPEQERVSVPGIMTEKEKAAAELLVSRAKDVGSNGTSDKRVVNPENILTAEGLAENHKTAEAMVQILVHHGVLRQIAENENSDSILRTYSVNDTKTESAKTVSLASLEKELRRLLRESQREMSKLRDKRNTLRAERDQINVQINALDVEMEKVSAEEGAINAKLSKFNNLLRELQKELSL